jgi:N-methylhydantoinase B
MKSSNSRLDPITLEVVHNNLLSIADESFYALMRSAYSTNIRERHDHSACIIDAGGRAVALAPHAQPIHLASMQGQIRTILSMYSHSEMANGDIFVSNDPYAAKGTHLPDVNFATPIYWVGELVAFCCNVAHHADVGGIAPGSMASNVEEIYQEGLRIPVVRLFEKGEMNADIMRMILLNVRQPVERRGDYDAQVASCRLAARRLQALIAQQGLETLRAIFDALIERTERRVRSAIEGLPDGTYKFEDVMDDDGVGTFDIPIKLTVVVRGDEITFDFTGTSSQVKGNINIPLPATTSAVSYAMVALIDRDIASNEGVFNAIQVIAEPGSLVNPTFPAPVAARTHTAQRLCDIVIGALAPAIPKRAIGASNGANTSAFLFGTHPKTSEGYLYFETYGGGCGARSWKDGKDGVQCHIANTANMPTEVMETEFPVIVEEYALAEDTAGAGKYRGGLALRRVMRPRVAMTIFIGAGERFRNAPWGLFNGRPGACGKFSILNDDGPAENLPPKPPPMRCGAHQRIVVQTPGAGGYGDPKDRDLHLLALDWHSGKFSTDYMCTQYGLTRDELERLPFDDWIFDYGAED